MNENIASNPPSHNAPANSFSPPGELYTVRGLRAFLQSNGRYLSRSLGQHFLLNRNLLSSVLDSTALPQSVSIIEIGPGLGHLTWLLLQRGLSVTAVEKDKVFAQLLQKIAGRQNVSSSSLHIIQDDALAIDFSRLAQQSGARHVIGNLPYNVATPILFRLAYCPFRFEGIFVMIQKEVGERITASPGSKAYGRLSIVLNYLYHVKKIRVIPPNTFFPMPKVDSIVLQFTPKPDTDIHLAQTILEKIVKTGFLHRRKKIRKQLLGITIKTLTFDESFLTTAEQEMGFDFEQRAEQWLVETWVRFAQYINDHTPKF